MANENWQKVREVFDAALRQIPEERQQFVGEVCGDDKLLLAEVESLLSSLDSAESFMETPAVAKVAEAIGGNGRKLEKGQTLGRYEIIEQIGMGGMGEVYLAQDKKLDRHVAIKILNEKVSQDKSNLNRFIQEAKSASALNHPNILTIYEFGEAENTYFIVSEFIEGKTLREILRSSTLGLSDILDISIQITNALSVAHKAHLIHRDIKPENVMIRPDGYVKILDFGLAKLIQPKQAIIGLEIEAAKQNETAKGMIMGTVSYMSPQQAKGEKVDERTDVFSLGVVIYEMIAGHTPFAGNSMSETFANLINQDPQPLSHFAADIPDKLQRIVSKMICKNKDERYQTMNYLISDLKDLLDKLKPQEKLEKSTDPKIENRTENLVVSIGEAKDLTFHQLTKQTARPKLIPTNAIIKNKLKYRTFITVGLILAVVLAGIGYGLYRYINGNKTSLIFQMGQVTRLTSSGKVKTTIVSPDGSFTIYAQEDHVGQQSLWMHHIASGSNVQIVPSSDVEYRVLNITPDGNSIYYVDEKQSVYQIPVLGGTVKKIAEGLLQNSRIGFSPDGKQFTFVRRFEKDVSALLIINADGTNERELVQIKQPMRLEVDPAWSPDGRIIACPVLIDGFFKILTVQVANGKFDLISSIGWSVIRKLAWLPDSNSLIFIGTIKGNFHQLFQILCKGGEARQITSDFYNYDDFSLTSDGRTLVAVKVEQTAHLWTTLSNDVTHARGITSGFEKFDGIYSLYWMSDSKILYTSSPSEDISIWTIGVNGDNPKLLKDGHYPTVSPDHRFIVYRERIDSELALLRMDLSDGSEKILSKGIIHYPTFSPDGKWLVFTKYNNQMSLWKVPIEGGEATQILVENALCSAVSPNGKTVAFILRRGGNPNRIALVSFDGGDIIKTFDAVPETNPLSNNQKLQWTSDGRGIYFIAFNNGVSNIWRQPIDGSSPVQVTKFETGRIFNFSYSPDGKQLALSRGSLNSDVVLIKNGE